MKPANIFVMLIAHGMVLNRGIQNKPTTGSSNTALAVKMRESCTNPNCKAKKWSTHSTDNCYWPGGGKEGQFPPNFGQKTQANTVSSNQETSNHFVLSARVANAPGNSGIIVNEFERTTTTAIVSKGFQTFNGARIPTFVDSGASNTMFVLREAFNDYKLTTL
jgi:hypothetical protein